MPATAPPTIAEVRANFAQFLALLSPVIPELQAPLFFVGTPTAVRHTLAVEWKLPTPVWDGPGKYKIIDRWDRLQGLDGKGRVLWFAPNYWQLRDHHDIDRLAGLRGFQTKTTEEFVPWLTESMHAFLLVQQNDGWPAQEALALKLLLSKLTTAASHLGKAQ